MSGQKSTWWLGGDRQWRKGPPPDGWRQGTDGRWHPPGPDPAAVAAAEDPTEPITISPPPSRRPVQPRQRFPHWMRLALGATAATTALLVALAATIRSNDDGAGGSGDGGRTPTTAASGDSPTATAPDGDPDDPDDGVGGGAATSGQDDPDDPSSTSTTSPTTTRPSTATTDPPPSSSDPLALCSRGQRQLIERGEHPPEWYVDRFDPDHDGIFCE